VDRAATARRRGLPRRRRGPALELAELEQLLGWKPGTLGNLADLLEARHFPAGSRVFTAGMPGGDLVFIRRGTLRVEMPIAKKEIWHIGTFGRGDFIGFLGSPPRQRRAIRRHLPPGRHAAGPWGSPPPARPRPTSSRAWPAWRRAGLFTNKELRALRSQTAAGCARRTRHGPVDRRPMRRAFWASGSGRPERGRLAWSGCVSSGPWLCCHG
jgi:hypothetical protein